MEILQNEVIGFSLFVSNLEDCIKSGSNLPYFAEDNCDLRNPKNTKDKEKVFKLFGPNASLDYAGNFNLAIPRDKPNIAEGNYGN